MKVLCRTTKNKQPSCSNLCVCFSFFFPSCTCDGKLGEHKCMPWCGRSSGKHWGGFGSGSVLGACSHSTPRCWCQLPTPVLEVRQCVVFEARGVPESTMYGQLPQPSSGWGGSSVAIMGQRRFDYQGQLWADGGKVVKNDLPEMIGVDHLTSDPRAVNMQHGQPVSERVCTQELARKGWTSLCGGRENIGFSNQSRVG